MFQGAPWQQKELGLEENYEEDKRQKDLEPTNGLLESELYISSSPSFRDIRDTTIGILVDYNIYRNQQMLQDEVLASTPLDGSGV